MTNDMDSVAEHDTSSAAAHFARLRIQEALVDYWFALDPTRRVPVQPYQVRGAVATAATRAVRGLELDTVARAKQQANAAYADTLRSVAIACRVADETHSRIDLVDQAIRRYRETLEAGRIDYALAVYDAVLEGDI